eukprot:TRINITY_DN18058_c0_g1_i1.p3 TRINITY_DN18058_c0_g1~~TRINITY_DN18058_c0_g1_i1.p3  ORF type:complete len:105 (-),score=2.78 TRINITY_DN18058_c0_g1_i1:217-531(-)
MNVSNDRSPEEAVAHRQHVWKLVFIYNLYIVQLDVEVLIHAMQRASYGEIVLQLDSDLLAYQCLEKGKEQHNEVCAERQGPRLSQTPAPHTWVWHQAWHQPVPP